MRSYIFFGILLFLSSTEDSITAAQGVDQRSVAAQTILPASPEAPPSARMKRKADTTITTTAAPTNETTTTFDKMLLDD